MKTLMIIITLLLTIHLATFGQDSSDKTQTTIASIDKIYIPQDLEDCFIQIDKILPDSIKHKIKAQTENHFSSQSHFGFGMWMRNNWKLCGGSRLSKYFNEKGIYHPDDMSGIILDSYYRHKTGKDIKFDEQIKHNQNYWKVVKQPSKDKFPKEVKKLEFKSGIFYDSKTNGQGFIHVGTTAKSEVIWLYDYYYGWSKATKADVISLEKNIDNREDILIEILNNLSNKTSFQLNITPLFVL